MLGTTQYLERSKSLANIGHQSIINKFCAFILFCLPALLVWRITYMQEKPASKQKS